MSHYDFLIKKSFRKKISTNKKPIITFAFLLSFVVIVSFVQINNNDSYKYNVSNIQAPPGKVVLSDKESIQKQEIINNIQNQNKVVLSSNEISAKNILLKQLNIK